MERSQVDEDAKTNSADATCNLFNWYRAHEGGLWLANPQEELSETRKRNLHPWITYDSEEEYSSEETENQKEVDVDNITKWRDAVCAIPSTA